MRRQRDGVDRSNGINQIESERRPQPLAALRDVPPQAKARASQVQFASSLISDGRTALAPRA